MLAVSRECYRVTDEMGREHWEERSIATPIPPQTYSLDNDLLLLAAELSR
jgi:hypothetical protein